MMASRSVFRSGALRRILAPSISAHRLIPTKLDHSLVPGPPQRYYHATPTARLSVRRRRRTAVTRRAADEEEDDTEANREKPRSIRHQAVTDPTVFAAASEALMDKLFRALTPMQRFNETFLLTRGTEDIGDFIMVDLGPVEGQYVIQVDLEQSIVVMNSPISGQIAYILSASTGEWCGEMDGHALEGLLVRDLIRQCNGVPDL